MMHSLLKFVVVVQLGFLMAGCTIHKLDIQQGNVITKDMVDRLTVGMTPRQVRFVMGSPLIQDPFHAGRWDYIYLSKPGDQSHATVWKRVTVLFQDEKLAQIVSDIDG